MKYANGVPCSSFTVIETPSFARSSKGLLTADEVTALRSSLETNPRAGVVVKGLGGCRKLRWRTQGRGKRGAARVIYLLVTQRVRIYLLLAYSKGQQGDLSEGQRRLLRQAAEEVKGK